MRRTIVTLVAAGAVGATSFALAGPALAEGTVPTASTVTAQVDRIKQALSGLVTDKTITQAQADKVASTLQSAGIGGAHGGPGGHGHGGPDLATAATTLRLTPAQLRTALEGGKTLAQVAADQKVSVDTLVSALVKAERAHIAQEVKDGRLTQAQADERLTDVTARVTERVSSTRPVRGDHGGRHGGPPTAPTAPTTPTPSATTS